VEILGHQKLQAPPLLKSTPYASRVKEFEKEVKAILDRKMEVREDKLNELHESLKLLMEEVGENNGGPVFISNNVEGQIIENVVETLLNLIIEAALGEGTMPVKVSKDPEYWRWTSPSRYNELEKHTHYRGDMGKNSSGVEGGI
jgi:hypothetical protein